MTTRSARLIAAAWALCASAALHAAEPPAEAAADHPVVANTPPVRDAMYQVGPGDTLAVQVYGEAALSGNFPVSSAGELDFPLLGLVDVNGLTAADVSAVLRSRLMPGFLINPNVTVSVSTYASQPVQVLGAVAKPGVYFLHGPTTVLQVLSVAGGVSRDGVNEVRVTHGGENGEAVVFPYETLLTQGADAIALSAGDVVFVPLSLVSVMGSVGKPGEIAFREGLTVSRCIAAAGGALPTANLGRVFVLRGDDRTRVNVRRVLAGKEPDLELRAGDRVIVHESAF